MVGGMNAFNLSDGLDGLAGGLAAIAAVFFIYFSWHEGALDLLLVSVSLLGSVLGFLKYNSYPARLFMGDCGSLTLGYVLAALVVSGSQREMIQIHLASWVMVVALPLQDTLLVMIRRVMYGHSPFLPDRTHLHHRLMTLGLAHPAVVAVMYAAMALFGTLALELQGYPDWYSFVALSLMGIVLFSGVLGLQHLEFKFNFGRRKRPYSTVRQWPIFKRFSRLVVSRSSYISVLLLFLLCLPALFFPLPHLYRNEALALLMLAGMVLFYSLHRSQSYKGMLHGSVYVSIFVLFFLYNMAASVEGHWSRDYLTIIALFAATWVVIKIVFRRNTAILMTSSFEMLMLFLSWFLPFVLFQELNLSEVVVAAGRLACLQVLPFMLAIKIYFNMQPSGNKWVVGILSGATVLIAIRGFMG
jgi:UDP-GlcNAc:undecaprenyl-phosphate GlcNAc-1-phosphate transferase